MKKYHRKAHLTIWLVLAPVLLAVVLIAHQSRSKLENAIQPGPDIESAGKLK